MPASSRFDGVLAGGNLVPVVRRVLHARHGVFLFPDEYRFAAFDDAPAEVREAAWARAAAAELADRAEALSRARGDVRGLAQAVTALRGMLSGEQLREVSGHA